MKSDVTTLFPGLPDSARVWIFGVGRPLSDAEEARVLQSVDDFLERWKAHGHPLAAGREWLYERFLIVGVDDAVSPPSGCSIDALVGQLRTLERELETEIVGGASVWYRHAKGGDEIRRVSRAEFGAEAKRGVVTADTTVFDLSLTRLSELRDGKWETTADSSWHRRYFISGSTGMRGS